MATFTQLASGNWRVQVRRKTRYVAETFRRRKDGEEWALEMERNIDRNGSSKPRAVRNVRTFGDLIDLHDEDMREVGKPPRRSKAAVMASIKTELGSVKLPALNRERLIEFGRKRAKQGAGPATLAINLSFIRSVGKTPAPRNETGLFKPYGKHVSASPTPFKAPDLMIAKRVIQHAGPRASPSPRSLPRVGWLP